MLYDIGPDVVESEKERNLYYKFFAGYFFNELVPGHENRFKAFKEILKSGITPPKFGNFDRETSKRLGSMNSNNTHISFDNHAYLLNREADRGEFADILIHDQKKTIMVVIEVKFLSDWNHDRDIMKNGERLDNISREHPELKFLRYLLITERKYENARKKKNQPGSNYLKWELAENPPIILLWETFLKKCDNKIVKGYLGQQLQQ